MSLHRSALLFLFWYEYQITLNSGETGPWFKSGSISWVVYCSSLNSNRFQIWNVERSKRSLTLTYIDFTSEICSEGFKCDWLWENPQKLHIFVCFFHISNIWPERLPTNQQLQLPGAKFSKLNSLVSLFADGFPTTWRLERRQEFPPADSAD